MTDTPTLEAQLTALCESADLDHLTIHIRRCGEFYAVAHAGEVCAHSTLNGPVISEAIKLAIFNLNAKRHRVEVADLAPIGELAA